MWQCHFKRSLQILSQDSVCTLMSLRKAFRVFYVFVMFFVVVVVLLFCCFVLNNTGVLSCPMFSH